MFFSTDTRPTYAKTGRLTSMAARGSGRNRSVSTPRDHIARLAKPRAARRCRNCGVATMSALAGAWNQRIHR
jgi:hypothetical protein